jgi:hypothetical protein
MTTWEFDSEGRQLNLVSSEPVDRVTGLRILVENDGRSLDLLDGRIRINRPLQISTPLGLAERQVLKIDAGGLRCEVHLDRVGRSPFVAVLARIKNGGKKSTLGKIRLLQVEAAADGHIDLGAPVSEYRVLTESGASGNCTGVRSIVANEGLHESKHLSVLYSPTNAVALLAGQGTVEETRV